MTKVIALGDLHTGHRGGLTPPKYQYHPAYKDRQAQLWNWYENTVKGIAPQIVICNGDAIEGKGHRNGGVEIGIPDLSEQAEAAYQSLKMIGADKYVLTYGTPSHVSGTDGTDYERQIATALGAEIYDHAMLDIDGVRFSVKHKIGSSGVPHGRGTALLKEALWDELWAGGQYEDRKRADVLLRSHVHYHAYAGTRDQLAMTLPCLQISSDYGARQCSGTIDFGMISFDIDNGGYAWKAHLAKLHTRGIVSL